MIFESQKQPTWPSKSIFHIIKIDKKERDLLEWTGLINRYYDSEEVTLLLRANI